MSRVVLTGMSGAGKSTVLDELDRRGLVTVDTDHGGWKGADGLWDEPRMNELLAGRADVVVSGVAENQGTFHDRFDHVVLLSAPLQVLIERVISRTHNPYGSSPRDRDEIVRHVQTVEPRLRLGSTVELDGRRPVAELAETIGRLVSTP